MQPTRTYQPGSPVTSFAELLALPPGTVCGYPQSPDTTFTTLAADNGEPLVRLVAPGLAAPVDFPASGFAGVDTTQPFNSAPMVVRTTPDTTGRFWGRTAEEWREMAGKQYRQREESWQRSDSDGFLSQWAHGEMSARYNRAASIAEDNGTLVVRALFDLDGKHIPARQVETQYGWTWGVYPEGETSGRFESWFNESKATDEDRARANNAKKGIYIGRVRVRAAMDKNYIAFPTEEVVEIVDNGQ